MVVKSSVAPQQHQGMNRPKVHKVPVGSGEQRKIEETGCEVICGALTTVAVTGIGESEEGNANLESIFLI